MRIDDDRRTRRTTAVNCKSPTTLLCETTFPAGGKCHGIDVVTYRSSYYFYLCVESSFPWSQIISHSNVTIIKYIESESRGVNETNRPNSEGPRQN
jgi:hypothetical protein